MVPNSSLRMRHADADRQCLIVDDSAAQRHVLQRFLQGWGYQITLAQSGGQALELCRQQSFDLILSDWMMPGMTGVEFCAALRSLPQDSYSYFILLTSKNDTAAITEGLNVGADDFVSKPVAPAELRARIQAGERLMAKDSALREARAQLLEAVEALDDGFVYYDREDRLVLANSRFRELYARTAPALREGNRFEDILRYGIAHGQWPDAQGQEEAWLRARLAAHHSENRTTQRLADGRVIQIVERPTRDGGRVGLRVDVTELHDAQEKSRAAEARALSQNKDLRAALAELKTVYDALDRDLIQARKLQHSLIREREQCFGSAHISMMLQSSGHVGGDMVGVFRIGHSHLGLYALDVSGHGVAAAILSARIAGLFSSSDASQNIALMRDPADGIVRPRPPAEVASRINDLMLREFETESYLTFAYVELDLDHGTCRMVQAGHPHPALLRESATVEFLGEGGLPIGLLPSSSFETTEFQLAPGDRLLLYSDGVTECLSQSGEEFGAARLAETLKATQSEQGGTCLDHLKWRLHDWAGKSDLQDDVSVILLDFAGFGQAAGERDRDA